jgi:hypothetical protein
MTNRSLYLLMAALSMVLGFLNALVYAYQGYPHSLILSVILIFVGLLLMGFTVRK